VVDNLQKNYKEELGVVQGARLLTKALCEIVDNPKQNLEIAVITEKSTRFLSVDEIEKLVASIEEEQPKK
jgi:20S proteasome alpha/beta subunit